MRFNTPNGPVSVKKMASMEDVYKTTKIDSIQITNGYVYFGYANNTIISAYCNANIFLLYVVTGEWYAKVMDSAGNMRESGTLNNVTVVYF